MIIKNRADSKPLAVGVMFSRFGVVIYRTLWQKDTSDLKLFRAFLFQTKLDCGKIEMFEWDAGKSEANLKKHGIGFDEAESAFEDFYAVEEFDDEHSTAAESRYKMLAMAGAKIVVVVYTMRGENYRLISAREAEKYERELYEKQRSEDV